MPSLLEQIAAAKRRGIRSAPQNAVLSHAAQGFQTQGFQNHIPARGRKHTERIIFLRSIELFQNHIPARGRKQLLLDKPKTKSLFQNHIPARGRKPAKEINCSRMNIISKPHPRKGTETYLLHPYAVKKCHNFKTTSSQGDGNT